MNPRATETLIEQPYNQIIGQKHDQLQRAQRYALGTECDPATAMPRPPTRAQLRKQLKTIQINVAAAGDTEIIAALAGVKQIFELVMWNVGAQDLAWQQGGSTTAGRITLLELPSYPATTGLTLGFNGNWDMPHWEIDNNQPLVLVTSAATRVTGFIRYRVENGSGN